MIPQVTRSITPAVVSHLADWSTLVQVGGFTFAATAQNYELGLNTIVAAGSNSAHVPVTVRAADWPAIGGKTAKMRLQGILYTNATAPAVNIVTSLYAIASVAGGSNATTFTLGSQVAASAVTLTSGQLTASTRNEIVSSAFTLPADGDYVVVMAPDGSFAANAAIVVRVAAQVHRA